jgi:dihydroneopterin aldolase
MLTSITIAGLETYAYHGLFEQERTLGQKFVFDLEAELGEGPSHSDDELVSSVRYDGLVDETIKVAQGEQFRTLEALGETIARALLDRFDLVQTITVSVAKLSPPIPHALRHAGVKVRLGREEIAPLVA